MAILPTKYITVVITCCFTTAQQSAQYIAKSMLNCDINTINECYPLVKKFHYLVETEHVS